MFLENAHSNINKLINIENIRFGKNKKFNLSTNILESLINKEILNQVPDNIDLIDMLNLQFKGNFGKNKKWKFDTSIGPNPTWNLNLSRLIK